VKQYEEPINGRKFYWADDVHELLERAREHLVESDFTPHSSRKVMEDIDAVLEHQEEVARD
jgi:hypothetical protein